MGACAAGSTARACSSTRTPTSRRSASTWRPTPRAFAWLHIGRGELEALARELGLHHHAIEDALKPATGSSDLAQRTKLERYPGYAFLYLFAARYPAADGSLALTGLPAFVHRRWLVTVAEDAFDTAPLEERWDANPDLLAHGTLALLHGLLDEVVDTHLAAVDALSDAVDSMEDALFDTSVPLDVDPRAQQREAFAVRKSLVRLRRVATPMRELVSGVMRREEGDETPIDAALMPYYQDVYDHVLRVNDTLEGLRDLVTSMYETRIAMADHTLNTVMKKLAAWAAIIAVPTAVTGFYGQNLDYPLIGTGAGFLVSTAIWAGGGAALWWTFRRRRWL